jgi:hypothetical protein
MIKASEVSAPKRPAQSCLFEATTDRHHVRLEVARVDRHPNKGLRRDPNHPVER